MQQESLKSQGAKRVGHKEAGFFQVKFSDLLDNNFMGLGPKLNKAVSESLSKKSILQKWQ